MALRKLERRNYGRKWLVSIKYQNFHSFKEGLTPLCQSIHDSRRITHLHDSAHFTIPLTAHIKIMWSIPFSNEHPICKTSLWPNKCLIKVNTKILQVYLSQFCNLLIVL